MENTKHLNGYIGRIKVSISSNSKSVLTICFTYSDGAKLEV